MKSRTISGYIIKNLLLVFLIFSVVLTVFLVKIIPDEYIKTHKNMNSDINTNLNSNFSELLLNLNADYNNIINDSEILKNIETIQTYSSYAEYTEAKDALSDLLFHLTYANYIKYAGLVFNNTNIANGLDDFNPISEYILNNCKTNIRFFNTGTIKNCSMNNEYILSMPIFDQKTGIYLCNLVFFANIEWFNSISSDINIIISDHNKIIYNNNEDINLSTDALLSMSNANSVCKINGKKYYIVTQKLGIFNWNVSTIVPAEKGYNVFNTLIFRSLFIFILIFAIMFKYLFVTSQDISEKISGAVNEMDRYLSDNELFMETLKNEKKSGFLSSHLKSLNLKKKIWTYNLIILVLPITLILTSVYISSASLMYGENEKTGKLFSTFSMSTLDQYLLRYDDIIRNIVNNSELTRCVYSINDENRSSKITSLNQILTANGYNDYNLAFYDSDKNLLYENYTGAPAGISNIPVNQYTQFKRPSSDRYILRTVKRLSYSAPLQENNVRYLCFDIDVDTLSHVLNSNKTNVNYYIIANDDTIISSNNQNSIGMYMHDYLSQNSKIKYHRQESSNNELSVLFESNEEYLHNFNQYTFLLLSLFFLLMMLLIIMQIHRIDHHILSPINNVQSALLKNTPIKDSDSGDELDLLVMAVKNMKARVNSLIDELYVHKIKENELELKALQSQITPHFLYNILEIINSLIDIGDDRAGTLVILLSKFFRQGISRGQSILSLRDELKYTNVYLDMQKTILEDRLAITVNIDESLYSCNVINFLFQPILENVFKHGEFDSDQKIRIKIKAYHIKDTVKIIIRDNGKGIPHETLLNTRNHIINGTAGKNIGLKNTNDRIKLYFGDEYGIDIYSVYGKGTAIIFTLPYNAPNDDIAPET